MTPDETSKMIDIIKDHFAQDECAELNDDEIANCVKKIVFFLIRKRRTNATFSFVNNGLNVPIEFKFLEPFAVPKTSEDFKDKH